MNTNDIGSIAELMRVARATNFEDMTWFTQTYFKITMDHLGIEGSAFADGDSPNRRVKLISGETNVFLVGNVLQNGELRTTCDNLETTLQNMSNEQGKSWVTGLISLNNGSPSIEFWSSQDQKKPDQDGPWDCERDQVYIRGQVENVFLA